MTKLFQTSPGTDEELIDWQESVLDKDLTIPPGSPSLGDRYIVAIGATGVWSGEDNNIAEWDGGSWVFTTANEGMGCYVEDEDLIYVYNGSTWVTLGSVSGVTLDVAFDNGKIIDGANSSANAMQVGNGTQALSIASYDVGFGLGISNNLNSNTTTVFSFGQPTDTNPNFYFVPNNVSGRGLANVNIFGWGSGGAGAGGSQILIHSDYDNDVSRIYSVGVSYLDLFANSVTKAIRIDTNSIPTITTFGGDDLALSSSSGNLNILGSSTNINGTELETLSDGSVADSLHIHNHNILGNLDYANSGHTGFLQDTNDVIKDSHIDWGLGTNKVSAEDLPMNYIGSPTYTSLKDWFSIRQEAGFISGGDVSDNGDGTVDVSAGTGVIKKTDSETGESVFFDWNDKNNLALTDNSVNYIVVQYNGGSPQVVAKQDINNINFHDEFVIGYCYRVGNTVHVLEAGNQIPDYLIKHCLVEFYRGAERLSGGMISETGNRYLIVTAGRFHLGITTWNTNSIDTSGADTFTAYYGDGGGGWNEQTSQTQVDNTHYDDGTGTLATLTSNRYNVFWAYLSFSGDLYLVYDQNVPSGGYRLSQALLASVPTSIPDILEKFSILAGKIIVQKNSSNLESVESAYVTRFVPSDVYVHNDLSGLQGGTTDEYYHLTSTEYGGDWGSKNITTTGTITGGTLTDGTASLSSGNLTGLNSINLISDTAYGSGWDGVTTIAPSKNAVYDQIELMLAYNAIGLSNRQWKPCHFIGCPHKNVTVSSGHEIRNDDSTDTYLVFLVDLEPLKGSKKCYIDGIRFTLTDADSSDYVNLIYIAEDGSLTLIDNGNQTSPSDYEISFTARDISGKLSVWFLVNCVFTTSNDFGIRGFSVRYYYDD